MGTSDTLTGGAGNDIFIYSTPNPGSNFGVITDFSPGQVVSPTLGDKIDLRRLDAIVGGADDVFVFMGSGAFTGVGQARATVVGPNTVVELNYLGDADDTTVDATITLTGFTARALVGSDFFL